MNESVADALTALCALRAIPLGQTAVPAAPGLYAVFADAAQWRTLGLGRTTGRPAPLRWQVREFPCQARPAHPLRHRQDRLLHAPPIRSRAPRRPPGTTGPQPRNPRRPGYFDKFGLEPAGDERLTQWMIAHVRIATWASSPGTRLDVIETEVLHALLPPLNIEKVSTPWRRQVKSARKLLADQARHWQTPAPANSHLALRTTPSRLFSTIRPNRDNRSIDARGGCRAVSTREPPNGHRGPQCVLRSS